MATSAYDRVNDKIDHGESCDEIVRNLASNVEKGEVPAGIFGNADVYARELRKIFARCWVFLGHESEIPNPKDYVQRKIGEDSFILARDLDGSIRVLLNACKHRGVQVCRADSGSASRFICPYHGWTYSLKGELVGAPLWSKALGDMPKAENGLLKAAQVDSYRGLIFATLDASAPPLEEYLGGMKWYLDLIFGLDTAGMEVLAPPQRVVLEANWKSGAENFAGDDYHVGTLHRAAMEGGAFPVPFEENMNGYHIAASPGHSLSLSMASSVDEPGPKFFGFPEDIVAGFDRSGEREQLHGLAQRGRVMVANVFPNFSIVVAPLTDDPSLPTTGMVSVRVWQPMGPDKIELWNWFIGFKAMSDEQKERLYRVALGSFSVGGLFEMDDTDPWITIARNGMSVAAETLGMTLNYKMGLPGVGVAAPVDDFPGPGRVVAPRFDEGVQRNLYSFYAAMMQAAPGEWPSLAFDGEARS